MPFVIHRVVGSRTVLETLPRESLRIGRGTSADLRFEDPAVGLEHAVVVRSDQAYRLRDLGSLSGTYVNGEPVQAARLRNGDEIEIGDFLIRVQWSDPDDPLFLHVRPFEAEPRPDAPPLEAPVVDYTGRYRLRRGLLNRAFLAFGLAVATVLGVLSLPLRGRLDAFSPGPLAGRHGETLAADGCGSCHRSWRGVANEGCLGCHGPGAKDETTPHHPQAEAPAQAASASCTACHREHRGRELLLRPAGDRACVTCHGRLELAPGIEPVFAAGITAFGDGHPEIHVTVPADEAPGLRGVSVRRLPLTDPEARRSDRAAIRLHHAKHLAPGLTSPEGRVQLVCADCHPVVGRDIVEVSFEAHCARCHALTFDDRLPDRTIPHGTPEDVAANLFLAYLEGDRRTGSTRDDVRRFLVPGRRPQSARERTAREEVRRAELRLYESRCVVCHEMDLDATPRPVVTPPMIPASDARLPYAAFPHGDHLALPALECGHCHERAATSTKTADVLLPGIGSCTPCHEAGAREGRTAGAGFPVSPGPTGCLACHVYHSGNRFPPRLAESAPRPERRAKNDLGAGR